MSMPFKFKQKYRDLFEFIASAGGKMSAEELAAVDECMPKNGVDTAEVLAEFQRKAPLSVDDFVTYVVSTNRATEVGFEEIVWGFCENYARATIMEGQQEAELKAVRVLIDPALKPGRREPELSQTWSRFAEATDDGAEPTRITPRGLTQLLKELSATMPMLDIYRMMKPKGGKSRGGRRQPPGGVLSALGAASPPGSPVGSPAGSPAASPQDDAAADPAPGPGPGSPLSIAAPLRAAEQPKEPPPPLSPLSPPSPPPPPLTASPEPPAASEPAAAAVPASPRVAERPLSPAPAGNPPQAPTPLQQQQPPAPVPPDPSTSAQPPSPPSSSSPSRQRRMAAPTTEDSHQLQQQPLRAPSPPSPLLGSAEAVGKATADAAVGSDPLAATDAAVAAMAAAGLPPEVCTHLRDLDARREGLRAALEAELQELAESNVAIDVLRRRLAALEHRNSAPRAAPPLPLSATDSAVPPGDTTAVAGDSDTHHGWSGAAAAATALSLSPAEAEREKTAQRMRRWLARSSAEQEVLRREIRALRDAQQVDAARAYLVTQLTSASSQAAASATVATAPSGSPPAAAREVWEASSVLRATNFLDQLERKKREIKEKEAALARMRRLQQQEERVQRDIERMEAEAAARAAQEREAQEQRVSNAEAIRDSYAAQRRDAGEPPRRAQNAAGSSDDSATAPPPFGGPTHESLTAFLAHQRAHMTAVQPRTIGSGMYARAAAVPPHHSDKNDGRHLLASPAAPALYQRRPTAGVPSTPHTAGGSTHDARLSAGRLEQFMRDARVGGGQPQLPSNNATRHQQLWAADSGGLRAAMNPAKHRW